MRKQRLISLLLALALLWGCGTQSTGAQDVYHRFDGEVLKEDALAPMSPPAAARAAVPYSVKGSPPRPKNAILPMPSTVTGIL